jgi:hypothetical protein
MSSALILSYRALRKIFCPAIELRGLRNSWETQALTRERNSFFAFC